VVVLVFLSILLSLSVVQTKLGSIATNYLNKDFNTHITVDKVDLSLLGSVDLKDVEIKDHHLDSMIAIQSLKTSIFSYRNILNNKLNFGDIELSGVYFLIKTYKGETKDAFSVFVDSFDEEKKDTVPSNFVLTSTIVTLNDGYFEVYDENKDEKPITFKEINGEVYNLLVDGPNFSGDIKGMQFIDDRQVDVKNLTTNFSYTRKEMKLENTLLETETSTAEADITFFRDGSFADFNNKVAFEADFKKADISLLDLHKFYNGFGTKDIFHFSGKLKGVLNDFTAKKIRMSSDLNLKLYGDFHLINSFNTDKGFSVDAQIINFTSDQNQLQSLLPNTLSNLPKLFKDLGRVQVSGNTFVNSNTIDAQVHINSDLGEAITDMKLKDISNPEKATYKGHVKIVDLALGKIIKDPLVGQLSADVDVEGNGVTLETIDVTVKGDVSKHQYKGYTYQDLKVFGQFQNKKFNGELIANDPNIKFDFIGLADLSSEIYQFDFDAMIDYADFNKLNLFKHDSISVLKGDMAIKLKGNTVEDLAGNIYITHASYTNQNDLYLFKDFEITSSFKDSVRTITLNSPDIINGKIEGVFNFAELGKVAQNAVGSIYTNYEPNEVRSGQYLDFIFNINDRIVEILFPEVEIGPDTYIKGAMDTDTDKLELTVRSPQIVAYGTEIDTIRLQIDNQNPLFNTQLSVNKVAMKNYVISDLELVNVTLNDTLYFRTQFFGGEEKTESFNLGFYHTIDENNKSVVGIQKSSIRYKNRNWLLNPSENKKNKVVFKNDFSEFQVEEFEAVSGHQKITLFGSTYGAVDKNLNLKFENVDLAGITPDIEKWNLAGLINGELVYNQKENDILPLANITIEDFFVNESYQGDLKLSIQGQNSVKRFDVDVSIKENDVTSLLAYGVIDFIPSKPTIGMHIDFDRLKLDILSPIGDENFTNMRGYVYGKATLSGLLENPDMKGELSLDEAGIALPYLGVDYDFAGTTLLELNNQSFEIVDLSLRDINENTTGELYGTISHTNFTDWKLDINLETKNLLVLNTKESEEEYYYGKAFIDGDASIKGNTDNLTITVNGKTNKGTYFVIPLSDVKTISSSKLVRFVTEDEELENSDIPSEIQFDKFKGLAINFNLQVTPDAVIEMILDKSTGSSLRGSGTGDLQIEIDTNGKFNMFGDFIIDSGRYDFKFAGLTSKRFDVTRGGTISWNGNPYTAEINIETIYRVYANPKVVLESVYTNRDIAVDLVARITGELYESDIEFDVLIPDADSDVKSELDFKINQYDNKIMHFGNLLLFGNFYNDQANLFQNGKGIGEDTAYQILSTAISGLINAGNDNFKLGVDYRSSSNLSDIEGLNTNDQVDISVKTKINDRILFDGSVGVPVGSNKQTTLVGEAKVEFLLNDKGTLRSTVFNRQNEIQYTEEEEGYTQGVGLKYQLDFDNGRELLEKLGFKKKKEEVDSIQIKKDSITKKTTKSSFQFSSEKSD